MSATWNVRIKSAEKFFELKLAAVVVEVSATS